MRLSEGIDLFVSKKRNAGIAYKEPAVVLSHFKTQVGDIRLAEITTGHVARFLQPNVIRPCMWHIKYNLLRRLFEHCVLIGSMPPLLMPDKRVRVRSYFVPYAYTQAEIRRLLEGASNIESRRTSASEARSFRTMLFLLYATGITLGEVVRLRRQDFDLMRRTIAVHNPRSGRSRSIPIDAYVCTVVRNYFKWRFPSPRANGDLFIRSSGRAFDEEVTQRYFGRMVRKLRLARRDGIAGWPRIADLRATFAVNRITEWLRNGTNMNKMLPALAAYLGHIGLYSVDRYLRLTPERFRKQLCALSPRQSNKHWRDNEPLMRFIASL